MRLTKEFDYFAQSLSALGVYPLHVLLILIFMKLELFDSALFLTVGLVSMYLIGTPLRMLLLLDRPNPPNHRKFIPAVTSSSFPSYHVSRLTFLTLFLSELFAYDLELVLLFTAITLIVAFARVHYGFHYVSDVIGGVFFGFVMYGIAWCVVG